jgi:ADP-ribosylglycohydrolase
VNTLDKIRGCLYGGAIGDALGYPVEFDILPIIKKKYGDKGIIELQLKDNKALISDDTQMSLFTAVGLTECNDNNYIDSIRDRYKEWLITQKYNNVYDYYTDVSENSWLAFKNEMYSQRAPGNTCITSIEKGALGTIDNPINNSKGCGGIMRVAPIALYMRNESMLDAAKLAAEASALTHGHPDGYVTSAVFVGIIHSVINGETLGKSIKAAFEIFKYFGNTQDKLNEIENSIILYIKAAELSKKDMNDEQAIKSLGQGWTADETLAIAVYCSLKYRDNFEKAIQVAVNHSGDSDSTGAVTGNIVGTYLGYELIPDRYKNNIELKDIINKISKDLAH